MRTTLQNVSFISSFPGRWRRQRIYPYIHTSSFSPRAFCSFHMTTNTKLLHYKKHDQRERDPHSTNVHSFVTWNTVTAIYAAKPSPEHLLYVEKVHFQILRG